jgi:hypothetical protein
MEQLGQWLLIDTGKNIEKLLIWIGAIVTLILGQVELVQVCNIVYKIWNLWSKGVFWEKDLLCFGFRQITLVLVLLWKDSFYDQHTVHVLYW